MPRARKRASGISFFKVVLFLCFLVGWTGLVAAGVWYFLREQSPPSAPPPTSPPSLAGLAEKTRDRLNQSDLASAGKIVSFKKPAGGGGPFVLAWESSSSEGVILAEKAVEDLWSDTGRKVVTEYPDHSPKGEKVRLFVYEGKQPGLTVILRLRPPPSAPSRPNPPPAEPPEPPALPKGHGRIAIIIDDIGNDPAALEALLALPVTLTFSVLPYSRYTDQACERLRQENAAVMLHLPMEPLNYPEKNPGEGALLKGMTAEEIEKRITAALARVPEAKGVNNHMGSAFTADREGMLAVLQVIKARGLFYVDSRTTRDTTALELARQLQVPSGQRRIFLDDSTEPDQIRARLQKLAELAEMSSPVIAIGHPHRETVQVLTEVLPAMVRAGYRFIPAAEAVQ